MPKILEDQLSTNGSNISGCIRSTYYKNGERNIEQNCLNGLGYEGVIEVYSCAIRGRNPENPSDRRSGINLEQRLEVSEEKDVSNCITSVSKDSMVLEKKT